VRKLSVLALVLIGCNNCGVVTKPPQSYFGLPNPPKLIKVTSIDFGCDRMFCSTQVSVWIELYNDKGCFRGVTIECEYEVSKQKLMYHTTDSYKLPASSSRVLLIPKMLMVGKPQYGTGLVRCRRHSVDGIGLWSKYETFEVAQRYRN
jgi:hypothetical protein